MIKFVCAEYKYSFSFAASHNYGDTYIFEQDGKSKVLWAWKNRLYLQHITGYKKGMASITDVVAALPQEQYIKDILLGHKVALCIRKKGLK